MNAPQGYENPPKSVASVSESLELNGGIGFPLSQEDIEDFRVLVRDECGIALTNQEAWNRASELLGLFRMLMGPIPEDPEASQSRL